MVQVARYHDGGHEIEQGVSDRKVHEHIHPVVDGADNDQKNGRLGTDHVHPENPVEPGRPDPDPVDHGNHHEKKGHPHDQWKVFGHFFFKTSGSKTSATLRSIAPVNKSSSRNWLMV